MYNSKIKIAAIATISLLSVVTLSFVVNAAKNTAAPSKKSSVKSDDKSKPLARIDNTVITVKDLEDRINGQIPFIRKRYKNPDELKKYLESTVDFEVLAKEAKKQGLDKNKEVLRSVKRVMIYRQRQKIIKSRVTLESITQKEVENYYKLHNLEFNRPERRRAAILVVKTENEAKKFRDEILKAKTGGLQKFQMLVRKNSIDEKTKKRGGLLQFVDAKSTMLEKIIVNEMFKLKKSGDLSEPFKLKNGNYAIVRLSGISPAINKPIDKVTTLIKRRLLKTKQQKAFQNYLNELKKKANVKIYEDKLDLVKISTKSKNTLGRNFHNPGAFRKIHSLKNGGGKAIIKNTKTKVIPSKK